MTMSSTTAKDTTKKATPNGANTGASTGASDTGAEDSQEKRSRGAVPTMPQAIVYKLGGKCHAVIHHPADGTSYAETGKGEGSAKGALEDAGFKLSPLTLDAPEWLQSKLPAGAELVGYGLIRGFPLPVQPK